MDEVFKMYAMSDGDDNTEPAEVDPITTKTWTTRTKKSKPPAYSPLPTTMRECLKRPPW